MDPQELQVLKLLLYQFSGYNHPAGALLGLGRLNVNVGNTIVLAADDLINIESQGRVSVSVGDYEGTTPVPSSGRFSYSQHIGGYDQTTGIQQPGTWFLAAGTKADLLSPLISIGSYKLRRTIDKWYNY